MSLAHTYRKSSHTAERVAAEVRRAIRHQELLPGEHVRQGWWAERVGVSSASTREALKVLVSEQLLTYDAHRGYFVTRIDTFEMSQIYRIRRLLEGEVLATIRWPDDAELRAVRVAMDEVIECVRRGDGHGALEGARAVSLSVFDLSRLDLIVQETMRFWDRAAAYRALELASVEDPGGARVAAFYAQFWDLLKKQDREGLIALNTEQRNDIPMRFENR